MISGRRGRLTLAGATVLAAGAVAGVVLLAWNPDYAFRRTPEVNLPAEAPHPAPRVRVLLTSDLGHGWSIQRERVVARMRARQAETPFDLVLVGGDNAGACGPDLTLPGAVGCPFEPDGNTVSPAYTPPGDPRFERYLDGPLAPLVAGSPHPQVFLALGNHDVASRGKCAVAGLEPDRVSRLRACLEVAHHAPTWQMPGRHYAVDAGPLRFIVIDGNILKGDYGGFDLASEEAFVRAAAGACVERTCFLVSHYPPATGGIPRRRESAEFSERAAALERAAGGRVRAWLTGHHHDLQHLRTPAGLDTFDFGNASWGHDVRWQLSMPPGAEQLFFSTTWGFAILEATDDRWWLRFEDVEGRGVHCCTASGAGRCEPERCSPVQPGPLPGARVAGVVTP